MRLCSDCVNMAEMCDKYKKIPPAGFAQKCHHFIKSEKIEIQAPTEQNKKKNCLECIRFDDGWCLQFDHPDFQYNFVKIKDDTICPLD